mmetsp:Transcript_3557/g.9685  ORF Transcript_3557/g.9685 Transcript_3557/m.9685 type:complete len:247 (+) Transcript_3557:133-873(+)
MALDWRVVTCVTLVVMSGAMVMRWCSAEIYDAVIVGMTREWYKAVLGRIPEGSRVLDVGIGTAGALLQHKGTLLRKNITVVGVDVDAAYVRAASARVWEEGVQERVVVFEKSVYDDEALLALAGPRAFDAVYFSGSFSLLPDPQAALDVAALVLNPGGRIYITQTYQTMRIPFLHLLKPSLGTLTTIDFGRLVYADEMSDFFHRCGLSVMEHDILPNSVHNIFQSAYITVLAPSPTDISPSNTRAE